MSDSGRALPPAPPGKETIFGLAFNALLFVLAYIASIFLADSYRNFRVGAACVAIRSDIQRWKFWKRYGIFFDGNTQIRPGWHPEKSCAEHKLTKAAESEGFDVIPVIAIVAPGQPDDDSGVNWGATIPCGHCRRDFTAHMENGGLIKSDTRIVAFNLRTLRCVRITVADLAGLRNNFRAD
ncbi:MAG: hypothetical protein NUV84_02215 [Candidatus Uhrbacteria bacterium]|nr:hypothetical protein [Candidatus Uhrbacteria bacterium]